MYVWRLSINLLLYCQGFLSTPLDGFANEKTSVIRSSRERERESIRDVNSHVFHLPSSFSITYIKLTAICENNY